jgi:hypothetical protein
MLHAPLGWFRERARPVAAAVLAALVALGGLSSAAHGPDCHDDDCSISLFPHDPASHSVEPGSAETAAPLHCVLCHWTRTTRPSTESAHHVAHHSTQVRGLRPEVLGTPSLVYAAQPPLRSPPVGSASIA